MSSSADDTRQQYTAYCRGWYDGAHPATSMREVFLKDATLSESYSRGYSDGWSARKNARSVEALRLNYQPKMMHLHSVQDAIKALAKAETNE